MEVIPWSISSLLNVSHSWQPERGPGDLHYYGQIPALNDCLYRYMYQTKYMALHDMDELILPQLKSRYRFPYGNTTLGVLLQKKTTVP